MPATYEPIATTTRLQLLFQELAALILILE
jgi:hypothetical protein